MAYQKQVWREYDDTKTELQNALNGALATPERLNHIENGIANSADKAEVTAQLQQTEQELSSQLAHNAYLNLLDIRPRGTEKKIPPFAFLTDDGHDTDFQVLKPLSDMYNVPFSMALVPSRPSQITDEHIQEALASGWDFGAHTLSHPDMSAISEEEIEYEMVESKKRIEARGLNVDYFVYPFNIHSPSARKVARKHFRFAVAGGNEIAPYPVQTYAIPRFAFPTGDESLETYTEQVDIAMENGQGLVFMLHATHMTPEQLQTLKDLIVYIKSKNAPIVNMTDWFNVMGNAISVPSSEYIDKFVLTNQGDIIGSGESIANVRFGINAKGDGAFSTVLGNLANGEGVETVAIGIRSHAEGGFSNAIGRVSFAARESNAIGALAKARGTYSNAIGPSSETVGTQSNAMGYGAIATGEQSVALGASAKSISNLSVAIGRNASSDGVESIALGNNAKSILAGGVSLGANAEVSGSGGIAIGLSAKASGTNAVAIGRGAVASRDQQMTLGTGTTQVTIKNPNGMILTSPDGTEYWVAIRDGGELRTQIVNI